MKKLLLWATVGGIGGFLLGLLEYGSKCVPGAIDPNCYPSQKLGIAIVTAAGLVTGIVASLLLRRTRWIVAAGVVVMLAIGSLVWVLVLNDAHPVECCDFEGFDAEAST